MRHSETGTSAVEVSEYVRFTLNIITPCDREETGFSGIHAYLQLPLVLCICLSVYVSLLHTYRRLA